MSDLDDKLIDIVDYCSKSYYPEHEYGTTYEKQNHMYLHEAIVQIKQAFADEPLFKLALAYKQAGGDTSDVFIISRRDADRNMQGFMTGQEWYERFEHEITQTTNIHASTFNQMRAAAKRAAGIDK